MDDHRIETGSCFCGDIRAELVGDPFWVNYDHDDDCRKAIGSPVNVWIGYKQGQVRVTQGNPKSFSKTPGVVRTFCANCGSSIGYFDEGLSGEVWLTVGFLDNPERFEPVAHGFWSMKLPWLNIADDLPRGEKYTRPRSPDVGYPADRKS